MANKDKQQAGEVENTKVDVPIIAFRDKIIDLARPNLFQVDMNYPKILDNGTPETGGGEDTQQDEKEKTSGKNNAGSGSSAASLSSFLIKAASIPASTVGVIDVPYRGRMLKIAGDRTFEPWTVTVLNDKNFALRGKFEEWSTKIQALQQNRQSTESIGQYQASATVRQLRRQGGVTRSYLFAGIWPSNISAIDLAWDSNDTVEEYTVEFQVQYWTYANNSDTYNAVDDKAGTD